MEIKQLKELKKIIIDDLNKIFSSKELVEHLKDDDFLKINLKMISFLNEIEISLKEDINNGVIELAKLNNITNKDSSFLKVDINDYFLVKDEIKYLDIYLFNVYKKNLNEFKNDLNDSLVIKDKSIANDNIINEPNENQKQNFNSNNNYQKNSTYDNVDPSQIQEQVYYQIANQRLMQEIKSGIFYVYDSKPKILPILKKILYVLFLLNGLIFLIPFFSMIFASGLTVPIQNPTADGPKSTTFNMDIFSSIIFLGFAALSLFYSLKNLLKKDSNENLIYYFSWFAFLFIGIFLVMSLFSLINTFSVWFNSLDSIKSAGNPYSKLLAFEIYLYSNILSYAFLGFVTIFGIVISFFNPKKDIARINEKMNIFIQEIKKQQANK